ncbi:predicted protein [Aspergillus terreus NIH2624]|uniref:Geodin cluster transcriptional coactivator gedD n=1 Tax=Aspergillus terreus (strain NIH 2624 / FGSC A1156) TaxID=341663 RepID=GEDD_ASPTN|nr:uncharacterized protein ATEG_08452 [Aspergillus terreus NIH2624]Q0CCY2.1 RecName: Full=Geodin cluster transcriptional coactivator gedD; AltName: Full=Geodin synthesis protein D [Aspergillus terreus NIH2624]EAU31625.1 predicted protein [Aspergillus terreus NIH2624]
MLLCDSLSFFQQLAWHVQLLACLQWLGRSQVLICLPLGSSFSVRDLAQLCGVSETTLSRVVRLTATAGFLQEPQPGQIMHTPLSGAFGGQPSLRDATLFLSNRITPSALQMASTLHLGRTESAAESAYNLAFATSRTFRDACRVTPKLHRQWIAYLRNTGDSDDSITEVLTRLDWAHLGRSCIVESGARSTTRARVLSKLYPALRFVVQLSGPDQDAHDTRASLTPVPSIPGIIQLDENYPHISVQTRNLGLAQPVLDAAVYILHLPSLSVANSPSRSIVVKELQAHMDVLSSNPSAVLIATARVLPPPGSVHREVEAMCRVRDFTLMQLTNEHEPEVADFDDLVNAVEAGGAGRLVVADKLRARNNLLVAFVLKYQEVSAPGALPSSF